MSALLKSVDWLNTSENLKRLDLQKDLLNKYPEKTRQHIIKEINNAYYSSQVRKAILKQTYNLQKHCYKLDVNNQLTKSNRQHLLHLIKENKSIYKKLDNMGQPLNDTPYSKHDVDSGNFVERLTNYNKATVNHYHRHLFTHSRKPLKWMDFLHNLSRAKLAGFSKETRDFQSAYLKSKQNTFSMSVE